MCRVCLLILVLNSLTGCVYYGFDGTLTYVAANWNAMKRPAFIVERREHRPMHNTRVRFYRLLHNHPAAEGQLHLTSSHTPAHRWEETPPLNTVPLNEPVLDESLMNGPPMPGEHHHYQDHDSMLVPPTPRMERPLTEPNILKPKSLPPETENSAPNQPSEQKPGEFPPAPETPSEANQSEPFPKLISPGDEEPELQPKDRVAEAGASGVI